MPDVPPPGQTEAPDPTEALAALAAQIERLRRAQDDADIPGLRSRFSSLTATLAGLAAQVAELADAGASGDQPVPSWLRATAAGGEALIPETASGLLDELIAWLDAVYVRFPDGVLPECWLWHPDVVEELLWLMHAWSAAYQGSQASVALVGDWHDRQRPGVVRRVRQSAGSCSFENHQTRAGWDRRPSAAPTVPGVDSVASIVNWWGAHRDESAPEPGPREFTGQASNGGERR